MIIGMRGHDFGRMEPAPLAGAIAAAGFRAAQLAFTKAFSRPAEAYMTPRALADIRSAFAACGVALPVMGCYVSAADADAAVLAGAQAAYGEALRASVALGAGCVGTETTPFSGDGDGREAAYARLLTFVRTAGREAEACGAVVGIEPVVLHTLNTPEMARRLLADVPSPNLRIILDLANLLTPQTTAPQAQAELLDRCLACFGDKITALHVKDGVFDSEGHWQDRPLGEGVMDWAHLLPVLRARNDRLCALREGVWPGLAREECALMRRWTGED